MQSYLHVIQTALLWFPIIAFLFTTPYMLYNYHKYGSLFSIRVAIIYSFILYLLCVYFLVILPLPPREWVAQLTTPRMQLMPFQFVQDMLHYSPLVWNDPSTYLGALFSPVIYQMLFNILMTVPFGMYLRYYFKCSFKKTLLFSFLLALFFELTQLSGLYGIYPRSYRLFDVDDLFTNTLGGILGYALVYPLLKILPSREEIDRTSYKRAEHISLLRRCLAFFLDYAFVLMLYAIGSCISFLLNTNIPHLLEWLLVFYFILSSLLLGGRTLGKGFMHIRIVSTNKEKAKWNQITFRYLGLFAFLFFQANMARIMGYLYYQDLLSLNMYALCSAIMHGLFFFMDMWCIYRMATREPLFYEKWSKTMQISTVLYAQEESFEKTKETAIQEETKTTDIPMV